MTADAASDSDLVTPYEVVPGIWRTQASMSSGVRGAPRMTVNAYLIVDGDDAAFVDTGWWYGVDTAHLDAVLTAADVAPEAVSTIVMTHAHRDHSGFVNYLEELTGATPWLHHAEISSVKAMAGNSGLGSADEAVAWYRSHGFPPAFADRMVAERIEDTTISLDRATWGDDLDTITVGSRRFEVVATPGHTDGHICLVERATGIFFSGDALLPRGNGNPHVTCRPLTQSDPLTAYVEGLQRLRRMLPSLCLPGHGPATDDPQALIESHLAYVDSKLAAVLEQMGDGPMTAYEVASALPWRRGKKTFEQLVSDELFLAFGDTLARLRRLVTIGQVRLGATADGVPTYTRV